VPLVARHGALTDIGLHRKANEDAFVVAPPLFAVCDGMGGAQAGEVASSLAAETLAAGVAAGEPLLASAEAANAAVFARAGADAAHTGMGTTLTAVLVEGAVGHFVHIGDSRAYLLRDGDLQQLSDDHSLVGEMIRDGRLTEEEAAIHPHRSILSRALGTEPRVRIDEFEVDLRGGDVLMLCSDGLCGVVPAPLLAKHMARSDPQEAARRLIAEARKAGGPDNITAVVVRLETPEPDDGRDEEEDTLVVPADEAVTRSGPALVPPASAPGAAPSDADAEAGEEAAGSEPDARPADGITLVVPPAAAMAAAAGQAGVADAEAAGGDAEPAAEAAPAASGAAGAPESGAGPAGDESVAGPDLASHPVPPAPEPAEGKKRRRRGLRWLAVILAVLVVAGSAGAVTLSSVYYVGNDGGRLAVYSGLPASLGPLNLHAVYRRSSVEYATLSAAQRALVDQQALRGRSDALALAAALGMDL
jgi:PPM family protein phosphatase